MNEQSSQQFTDLYITYQYKKETAQNTSDFVHRHSYLSWKNQIKTFYPAKLRTRKPYLERNKVKYLITVSRTGVAPEGWQGATYLFFPTAN